MRRCRALGWLSLAVVASLAAGCAKVVDSHGPLEAQPHHIEASRSVATDWDRLADPRPSRVTAVAASASPPPAQPPPGEPPRPVAEGGPATQIPASVLWPKEPWEIELDKVVRNICRGC